jgi:addiction module RelB/DinJ family antitoxin
MERRRSDATIQVRTSAELKKDADSVLKSLGFTLSDGINVFLRQVVVDRALPFQPHMRYARGPEELDSGLRPSPPLAKLDGKKDMEEHG